MTSPWVLFSVWVHATARCNIIRYLASIHQEDTVLKLYSPAVKQQISEVAFKIWLKHETFLVYRVLCAESNKIETHFQLWSESCVNWGYLLASDSNLFCKIHFQLLWPTCLSSVNNWSNMNCLHELYINIMNCCDLEYFCVLKMWLLKEIKSKYTAVSHMTKIWIEHYSLTNRFRIVQFSTQSHQGTYYVDQVT